MGWVRGWVGLAWVWLGWRVVAAPQGRAGQGRTGRCDCAHVAGEDMLRRCMRATFTDVSTLGIVMGDTNMTCHQVEDATQYGTVGSPHSVEYHPGPLLLEICSSEMQEGLAPKTFFAHPKPKECTDFIFAGDADVELIKPFPQLVGLDGEHVAIAATVVPMAHPAMPFRRCCRTRAAVLRRPRSAVLRRPRTIAMSCRETSTPPRR